MKKVIIICSALLTTSAALHAQTGETKVAEARIERQLNRLKKGMQDWSMAAGTASCNPSIVSAVLPFANWCKFIRVYMASIEHRNNKAIIL